MAQTGPKILSACIPAEYAGRRLDQALPALFPEFSRSQLQQWIRAGAVSLNAAVPSQRQKLAGGEWVKIHVPETPVLAWQAQTIPLTVVYEDEELLVIDKPAGLVVHPGAGHAEGTLLNALLAHAPVLKVIPRAGIVHRLDKDTSGLLAVAKTTRSRLSLIKQLRDRHMHREYLAVVRGVMVAGGTVEAPIGRHPKERTRMAVTAAGKPATSHYRVLSRYRAHSLLRMILESGRTHQIRVHLAHLRYPILGDPVYGGRLSLPPGVGERLMQILRTFRRQALHAAKLGLIHPASGETMAWTSAPPADMQALIEALAEDAQQHTN